MRQFLRKRVPAFLLTLVMVMTLVPAASARSSADITYEVEPGDYVVFDLRDFEDYYDTYESDYLEYMEFTDSTGVDSNGTMYAYDYYNDECSLSESQLYRNWFYADDDDMGRNDYEIDGMNYLAKRNTDGETVELSFTLHGNRGGKLDGILRISIGGSASSRGDITYSVKAGDEVVFDEDDFEAYYDEYCTGDFKYVTFSRPGTDYTSAGTIYYEYGRSRWEESFSRSTLAANKFYYYNCEEYGDYALDDLSFVADDDFEDSLEIGFTVYGGTGSNDNRSKSGTLVITADGKASSSSKGDISYSVKPGEKVAFDEDDFEAYYDEYCTGDFKYVTFSRPGTDYTSAGTIYYEYGSSRREESFTRTSLSANKFYYYNCEEYGDYALDELSFVADDDFEDSLEISFTVYGGTGSNDNRSKSGTLVITADGKASSSSKGDISYSVKPGEKVAFDEDDFKTYYDKYCIGDFKYVEFSRPGTDYTSAGTIYYEYGSARREESFTRTSLSNSKFYYYDCESYGDYALDDLSFVASRSFSGSLEIGFTVYGGTGRNTNKSETGTLVITTGTTGGSSTSAASGYVGNIRYNTTAGTLVQINANDISRHFQKYYPGSTLSYVALTGVPSTGALYYNYYGASQYGSAARMQLTSTAAAGKQFFFSPASTGEYALSELTYVPSGSNYCTAITFAAYGKSITQMVTGTILISVTNSAVSELYSVTTRGTSVSFPASSVYSAVAGATGQALSSIQLLQLPAVTAGVLYAGSSAANTTTRYDYSTLSQLFFMPNSGYTGSVTIPYVALNGSGVAIAAGQYSIGVVNSVKKFSDVSNTTWCYKYVTELASNGVISGYSNGTFQEKSTITYGAALKLVMLAAGYGEQAPTTKGSTFSGYLTKAKADGLVTGNPNLSGSITRLQIAQIAAKALKLSTSDLSNKKPFTDTNDVYVQALNAAGIIEGYFANGTSTYKPNNTLTRGQVSAIVWRMQNSK